MAAWWATIQRAAPRRVAACSTLNASTGMSMSGSTSAWLGWAWCSLCWPTQEP